MGSILWRGCVIKLLVKGIYGVIMDGGGGGGGHGGDGGGGSVDLCLLPLINRGVVVG